MCHFRVQMCMVGVRKETEKPHKCRFLQEFCAGYVVIVFRKVYAEGGI